MEEIKEVDFDYPKNKNVHKDEFRNFGAEGANRIIAEDIPHNLGN